MRTLLPLFIFLAPNISHGATAEECDDPSKSSQLHSALMKKVSCGTKGSLLERKKDCAKTSDPVKKINMGIGAGNDPSFTLITRTAEGKEIWQSNRTKNIYTEPLPVTGTWDEAKKACQSSQAEMAGITAVKWDLFDGDELGLQRAFPKVDNKWFWVNSTPLFNKKEAYATWYNKQGTGIKAVEKNLDSGHIWCVAKNVEF